MRVATDMAMYCRHIVNAVARWLWRLRNGLRSIGRQRPVRRHRSERHTGPLRIGKVVILTERGNNRFGVQPTKGTIGP